MTDNFYLISWAYYCRQGCKTHFVGWSPSLLSSLPRYLQLAFPVILLCHSGLSNQVITQLRVANQHKMGPNGVHSLLLELHTLRFSTLQAQYLEAVFEVVAGIEQEAQRLHAYLSLAQVPSFGDFGSHDGYAGFVPGERYLSKMMNKAIEADEHDANQHTALLAPDQIAIDDSHKVNLSILQIIVSDHLSRSRSISQRLTGSLYLGHYGLAWTLATFAHRHSL